MTPLPRSGSIKIDAAPLADGETRTLIDDAGYQTLLMRVVAGPLGTLHDHDKIEQIYVIEGDFFDDDESYGAGDFVLRMPGTMHRAGSRNGCTMLITYMPFVEARP